MTHSPKWIFNFGQLIRVSAVICVLVFMSGAATPRLGADDIPELPMPDGSGDTPEMVIDLLPNNVAGPAINQPKQIKLSSLRGRVVLIDMFWSKCPHCEE